MTKSKMNPEVDFYFNKAKSWQEPMEKLRMVLLDCGLAEELKWGVPCYTFGKANIVLIHAFKEYCALMFINGALLKDENSILIQQTKDVQAGRQIRFTQVQVVNKMKPILKAYTYEAIEIEKAGLKVNYKETAAFIKPEELQQKLDGIATFKNAFNALTPGRQRAYIFYFSAPKQSRTREARIEKYMQKILHGKGLNDA